MSRQQTPKPPAIKAFAGQTSQSDCNNGRHTDVINLTDSPEPAKAGQAGNVQLPQLCSLLQPQVCITPSLCPSNVACSQSCPGLTFHCAPLSSLRISSEFGNCRAKFLAVILLLLARKGSFQSRRLDVILNKFIQPSLALRHKLLALRPRSDCSDLSLLLSYVQFSAHQEVSLQCIGSGCHELGVIDGLQVEGESHNAVGSASESVQPAQQQDRTSQVFLATGLQLYCNHIQPLQPWQACHMVVSHVCLLCLMWLHNLIRHVVEARSSSSRALVPGLNRYSSQFMASSLEQSLEQKYLHLASQKFCIQQKV